jgi:hypothetical protein
MNILDTLTTDYKDSVETHYIASEEQTQIMLKEHAWVEVTNAPRNHMFLDAGGRICGCRFHDGFAWYCPHYRTK